MVGLIEGLVGKVIKADTSSGKSLRVHTQYWAELQAETCICTEKYTPDRNSIHL